MKAPITVLLVEDDKDDQFFFLEALREIDNVFLYAVATNGQEALDRLRDANPLPDVIITDINMPVMGGLECLVALRKDTHTKDIPVVILSGDSSESQMACHLGAKAFIKKSWYGKPLRDKLEELLNLDLRSNNEVAYRTFAAVEELKMGW